MFCPKCVDYFDDRGLVLARAVRKAAAERSLDADDLARRYALGVHERHLSGLSLAVTQ